MRGLFLSCASFVTGVNMLSDVTYRKVDDDGLHILQDGKPRLLEVDNVVVCAGQEPLKDLQVTINRCRHRACCPTVQ